jgi:hypothetical protein
MGRRRIASGSWEKNLHLAQQRWPGELNQSKIEQLKALINDHGLTVLEGGIQLLEGNWYVTHAGLLKLARQNRCSGIQTEVVVPLSEPASSRWVVKATIFKTPRSKGFVGYGDADPNNVSALVRGAELRIAETRAVNRALRKAYGIGLCSVEEIGASRNALPLVAGTKMHDKTLNTGPHGGQRLRDRICLLIRQHHLDSGQVKRYATAFCGTGTLRQASREQVEKLVNHLFELAAQGRDQLLAELAPYAEAKQNDDREAA